MHDAHQAGKDVARVHSGDPSLYGAIGEQIRRLVELGIDYDITPGVPAYAAAAAALGQELTLPGISQTVVLTRTTMRSSDMPNRETLETLAHSRARRSPSTSPRATPATSRRALISALRRGLPRGHRRTRELAGRAHHPVPAGRAASHRQGRAHSSHRADSRRSGVGRPPSTATASCTTPGTFTCCGRRRSASSAGQGES